MQLPGLVLGPSRKLPPIDIIFALEGAHPRFTCAYDWRFSYESSTEGMTAPVATHAYWYLAALANNFCIIGKGRRGLGNHTERTPGKQLR